MPYQHGSIQLAGKGIQGPGAERGVVFQNEGLLPWRNVQDNVAFGLQLAGVEKMQRLEIAHQMVKKVGLEGAEKRYILSLIHIYTFCNVHSTALASRSGKTRLLARDRNGQHLRHDCLADWCPAQQQ